MTNKNFFSNFHRSGIVSIFLAVPFVSITGLFGKWLSLPPILIVQWRTIFASIALLILLKILREKIFFKSYRDFLWFFIGGLVLGVHWIAFFRAIQVSTVAIGLLSYVSYPLFTSVLEPIFFSDSKKVTAR